MGLPVMGSLITLFMSKTPKSNASLNDMTLPVTGSFTSPVLVSRQFLVTASDTVMGCFSSISPACIASVRGNTSPVLGSTYFPVTALMSPLLSASDRDKVFPVSGSITALLLGSRIPLLIASGMDQLCPVCPSVTVPLLALNRLLSMACCRLSPGLSALKMSPLSRASVTVMFWLVEGSRISLVFESTMPFAKASSRDIS